MSSRKPSPCVGAPAFDPQAIITDTQRQSDSLELLLSKDDLLGASRTFFSIPERDTYTYHAMTSVKLGEVQRIIGMGGVNGLHGWYRREDGTPVRLCLLLPLCFYISKRSLERSENSLPGRGRRRPYNHPRGMPPAAPAGEAVLASLDKHMLSPRGVNGGHIIPYNALPIKTHIPETNTPKPQDRTG